MRVGARALLVPAFAVLLGGCFASRGLKALEADFSLKAARLESIEPLEASQPEKALARYGEFLREEAGFGKPLQYYQSQLRMQLRQMGNSQVQILGDDVLAAYPHYFHKRLGLQVRARLGSARIHLKRGDPAAARKEAEKALELIAKRSRSPLFEAREARPVHGLLRSIHEGAGAPGPALLAKLREDLAADYMAGAHATAALAAEGEAEERSPAQFEEIDRFIAKVNRQRTAAAVAELTSALSEVVGGFDIGDAAKGATQALASSMNLAGALSAPAAGPSAQLDSSLAQPAAASLGSRILEPAMGANPHGLFKDFAAAAARLDAGQAARQAAENLQRKTDALLAARGRPESERAQALGGFAGAFSDLEGILVVRGGAAAPAGQR